MFPIAENESSFPVLGDAANTPCVYVGRYFPFFEFLSIVAEQTISAAEPQVSLKIFVDGETVADIRAFLGEHEGKVFAIKAGDAFEIIVEKDRSIPNPYITLPVLHNLRDFNEVSSYVRARVENVDTMRIV